MSPSDADNTIDIITILAGENATLKIRRQELQAHLLRAIVRLRSAADDLEESAESLRLADSPAQARIYLLRVDRIREYTAALLPVAEGKVEP